MAASAISACEKAGQWRHIVALLPDVISNTSANNACDKGGRRHHALGLLLRMRNNLLPDVIRNNTAICACEKGGRWQHALRLLVGKRHSHVWPDVSSYTDTLISCPVASAAVLLSARVKQVGNGSIH